MRPTYCPHKCEKWIKYIKHTVFYSSSSVYSSDMVPPSLIDRIQVHIRALTGVPWSWWIKKKQRSKYFIWIKGISWDQRWGKWQSILKVLVNSFRNGRSIPPCIKEHLLSAGWVEQGFSSYIWTCFWEKSYPFLAILTGTSKWENLAGGSAT